MNLSFKAKSALTQLLHCHSLLLLLLLLPRTAQTKTPEFNINLRHIKTIESYMQPEVEPCEDFFSYACGNWAAQHNHTRRYAETMGYVDHKINKKLAQLLQNHTKASLFKAEERQIYELVRTYYKSCKRERGALKLQRYLQLVRPFELQWYWLQPHNWPQQRFNWLLTLAKLQSYGLTETLIKQSVLNDLELAGRFMLQLDKPQPAARLPLLLIQLLGISQEQWLAVEQLEARLDKLLAQEHDDSVEQLSLAQLEQQMPQLHWCQYISLLLRQNVSNNFELQLRNAAYFAQLHMLLAETATPTICNYLMLSFLSHLKQDAAAEFEQINCVVDVRSKMDVATNFLYERHYLSANKMAANELELQQLFKSLQQQFARAFQENHLHFEPQQLAYLLEKLRHMRLQIGSLHFKNAAKAAAYIRRLYEPLQLSANNYYHNHLALLHLRFERELQQLTMNATSSYSSSNFFFITDSDMARSSTLYYLMRQNLVVVPHGILQPPIFQRRTHALLKRSLLGYLLAHEMAHAFDVTGIMLDREGRLQDMGYNMSEQAQFQAAVSCLQRTQPTESIDERMADVVGSRMAYEAYFGRHDGEHVNETMILDFAPTWTARRFFILNLAQFFCGSMQADFLNHDTDKVRLEQIMRHFEPFREEFGCQMGDRLYAEESCRVW